MTNHGGCAILNEMITYPDRKETRKNFRKQECHGGVMKSQSSLVPIFSAMDGTVLYSIMEECFTKCTDVNSDGIWCCGGVKYPSTCYRKISTWSHIQDYETRINNVCCIRGRISSCLWWDSVSALRI